jgi:hypothetical protein
VIRGIGGRVPASPTEVVADHLQRFGQREELEVVWS